ncbi:hypothetical protein PR002_g4324 [Phytophthora rubi]|uniref:Uncharacterized protein n=1 Tax=Phytophthora rubi TaxID=129364 RepID=A0A6A3NDJ3_9STRA|nr:hypothetical protein PR002_g4324 [Phytophthora rubi]
MHPQVMPMTTPLPELVGDDTIALLPLLESATMSELESPVTLLSSLPELVIWEEVEPAPVLPLPEFIVGAVVPTLLLPSPAFVAAVVELPPLLSVLVAGVDMELLLPPLLALDVGVGAGVEFTLMSLLTSSVAFVATLELEVVLVPTVTEVFVLLLVALVVLVPIVAEVFSLPMSEEMLLPEVVEEFVDVAEMLLPPEVERLSSINLRVATAVPFAPVDVASMGLEGLLINSICVQPRVIRARVVREPPD